MLLVIHNLPNKFGYGEIKSLIREKCGESEWIYGKLTSERGSKHVTVGCSNDSDALLIENQLNGLVVLGQRLHVERITKSDVNEPASQPYYASSTESSYPPTRRYGNPIQYGQDSQGCISYPIPSLLQPKKPDLQEIVQQPGYGYISPWATNMQPNPTGFVQPNTSFNYNQPMMQSQVYGDRNDSPRQAERRWSPSPSTYTSNDNNRQRDYNRRSRERDFGRRSNENDCYQDQFNSSDSSRNRVGGSGSSKRRYDDRDSRQDYSSESQSTFSNYQTGNREFGVESKRPRASQNDNFRDQRDSFERRSRFNSRDEGNQRDEFRNNRFRKEQQRDLDRRSNDADKYNRSRNDRNARGDYSHNLEPEYSGAKQYHNSGSYSDRSAKYGDQQGKNQTLNPWQTNENTGAFDSMKSFGMPTYTIPKKKQKGKNPIKAHSTNVANSSTQYLTSLDIEDPKIRHHELSVRGFAIVRVVFEVFKAHNKGLARKTKNPVYICLKDIIRKRVDIMLGSRIGATKQQIYHLYRSKFPMNTDKLVYDAAISKASPESAEVYDDDIINDPFSGPTNKPGKPLRDNINTGAAAGKPIITGRNTANSMQLPIGSAKYPKKPKPVKQPKSLLKQRKIEEKMEATGKTVFKLDDGLEKCVDEELQLLTEKMFSEVEVEEGDEQIFDILKQNCGDDLITEVKRNITKRLLNVTSGLNLRIFGFPKLPKRIELLNHLEQFGVLSLKKSVKGKMYLATVKDFDSYDNLIAMVTLKMDENEVTFKSLQLTGPGPKISRSSRISKRRRNIQKQIEPVDMEELRKYKPDLHLSKKDRRVNNISNLNNQNQTVSTRKNSTKENVIAEVGNDNETGGKETNDSPNGTSGEAVAVNKNAQLSDVVDNKQETDNCVTLKNDTKGNNSVKQTEGEDNGDWNNDDFDNWGTSDTNRDSPNDVIFVAEVDVDNIDLDDLEDY